MLLQMLLLLVLLAEPALLALSASTPPSILPFRFRPDLAAGDRTRVTCEAGQVREEGFEFNFAEINIQLENYFCKIKKTG